MPILTPNFSLPVPGPLDPPCEFAQQWCDFTNATQAVLDKFEAIANRTNPWVPLAKMELRTAVTVPADSSIPFDTLTLNNAGMVDFDTSNTTVVFNRSGRFMVVCNVLFRLAPTPNMWFNLQALPSGAGTINRTPAVDHNINISGTNTGSTLSAYFYITTPPVVLRINTDMVTTPDTVTIELASLSVFWFADGATP